MGTDACCRMQMCAMEKMEQREEGEGLRYMSGYLANHFLKAYFHFLKSLIGLSSHWLNHDIKLGHAKCLSVHHLSWQWLMIFVLD